MLFSTTATLKEFRGFRKYATFTVPHSSEGKFYYAQFYIDPVKFGDIEFKEGKIYELTIQPKIAIRRVPDELYSDAEQIIELTRTTLFLNAVKEVKDSKLIQGRFRFRAAVINKKYMELEEGMGIWRIQVERKRDEKEEPFYIWDYARFDFYDYLESGKKEYIFNCQLFNKTHYTEEGVPSNEKEELLNNGKNKFYTEIKILSVIDA